MAPPIASTSNIKENDFGSVQDCTEYVQKRIHANASVKARMFKRAQKAAATSLAEPEGPASKRARKQSRDRRD